MAKAKDLLMSGLGDEMFSRFVAVLDGLDRYREPELFRREVWQPGSELHKTLATAGLLAGLSKKFVETLPAAKDLNVVAEALEQVTQGVAPPEGVK